MSSEPAPETGWRSERATLFLSAVAMTALAVAQPLLDLLGRTPEFFTARAAPTSDVVLLGLLLGLVIPLTAGAVVLAAHHFSPAVGRVVHASVIVVSGALLTLAVLAHTPAAEWPAGSVLVAAFVAGAGLAFAFRKSASTREVLRYAAVAPAVVVVLFLMVAPTSRLVWGAAGQRDGGRAGRRSGTGGHGRVRRVPGGHADRRLRRDPCRPVPRLRPARRQRHLVPQRRRGPRAHRGGAADDAVGGAGPPRRERPQRRRLPRQPVHVGRGRLPGGGGRVGHRPLPNHDMRRGQPAPALLRHPVAQPGQRPGGGRRARVPPRRLRRWATADRPGVGRLHRLRHSALLGPEPPLQRRRRRRSPGRRYRLPRRLRPAVDGRRAALRPHPVAALPVGHPP